MSVANGPFNERTWLGALPVMIEPAFYGIKLSALARHDLVRCGIGVVLERNLVFLRISVSARIEKRTFVNKGRFRSR